MTDRVLKIVNVKPCTGTLWVKNRNFNCGEGTKSQLEYSNYHNPWWHQSQIHNLIIVGTVSCSVITCSRPFISHGPSEGIYNYNSTITFVNYNMRYFHANNILLQFLWIFLRMTNLLRLAQSWRMPPLEVTHPLQGLGVGRVAGVTRNGGQNCNSSVPILWRFGYKYILHAIFKINISLMILCRLAF